MLSRKAESLTREELETTAGLVEAFGHTSFQGRNLHTCAEIWMDMLRDVNRPTVFLGMSGALVAGGLRNIIVELVRDGCVDVIVTTGAIAYQDFYRARGHHHYLGNPETPDDVLFDNSIDRIYDTFVDEEKFRETDLYIGELTGNLEKRGYSSREFLEFLGSLIDDGDSILKAAYDCGVPVFCPAIADSSIGIGLGVQQLRMREEALSEGKDEPKSGYFFIDNIRDNIEIARIVAASGATAAVFLGGGVPKNYINDAVVMADMMFGIECGHEYAIQITMDRPEWGGLSGSTLEEAKSWGKVGTEAKKCMAFVEMTVALPLVAAYVFEKAKGIQRKRPKMTWDGTRLKLE